MLRLKQHRELKGLTVRGLAELSGIHYVTLVRLEHGQMDPKLSTLLKLTKALGISIAELVVEPKRKGGR